MRLTKKGQGATEYLLMLAAVLVIVGVAVYFITRAGPAAFVGGTATLGTDNVTFTPSSALTPSPLPAADWRYCILKPDKTIRVDWTSGPADLVIGTPITLTATGVKANDWLRIQYKLKDYWDIQIVP